MNPPDDSQSGKQLEVARIGGGPSARMGALVVGVILVVVIGVAIAGRPPAPPTPPAVAATPAAVAADETPLPTTAPPTAPATPGRAPALDLYGASLLIGDVRYEMMLDNIGTSRLSADIRVPLPQTEANGVLDFNTRSTFGSVATVKSISEVTMEVTLGPRPGITGDDGLIGWPTGPI